MVQEQTIEFHISFFAFEIPEEHYVRDENYYCAKVGQNAPEGLQSLARVIPAFGHFLAGRPTELLTAISYKLEAASLKRAVDEALFRINGFLDAYCIIKEVEAPALSPVILVRINRGPDLEAYLVRDSGWAHSHTQEGTEKIVWKEHERKMLDLMLPLFDISSGLTPHKGTAWVDKFEIHSGDSIVQKIFTQGIENAKAVIAVISKASVVKPWVQNEIDIAFVRRIEGKCKLIPVILDNASPPTCLSALRWEPVADPKNFDAALHNILLSIFDQYEKPRLGQTPAFVTTEVATIPGISLVDSKVLIACCRLSEKMDQVATINGQDLEPLVKELHLTMESFCESLEVLHHKGLVKVDKIDSGSITGCGPTFAGYDVFVRAADPKYVAHFTKLVARIVNNGDDTGTKLVEATGLSARTMYHFLKLLQGQGHIILIENINYSCAFQKIARVNATLRRYLETLMPQ
jgi:hypothetical protein